MSITWTQPKTWGAGALTSADLNQYVRDNHDWLKATLALHGMDSATVPGKLRGAATGCVAYRSTTQSFASGTAANSALNATDLYDPDAMHDTATPNDRIVIPVSGLWRVGFAVNWAPNAAGGRRSKVRLNDASDVPGGTFWVPLAGANSDCRYSLEVPAVLTAGDFVTCEQLQGSGGNLNTESVVFWALLVGVI